MKNEFSLRSLLNKIPVVKSICKLEVFDYAEAGDFKSVDVDSLLQEFPDCVSWDRGGDHYTLLHYAARFGEATVIEKLVRAGAEKDLVHIHTGTPIYTAVMHDQPDAIRKLYELGASLDLAAPNMHPPVAAALSSLAQGKPDCFRLLVELGAALDIPTQGGATLPLENYDVVRRNPHLAALVADARIKQASLPPKNVTLDGQTKVPQRLTLKKKTPC